MVVGPGAHRQTCGCFPLPDLKANARGIAVMQATIDSRSIPATGWYINVHQVPGMDTPLACGLVQPPM